MAFNMSCRCPDQLLALGDFVRAAQDDTGVSAEAGQKRFRTQWKEFALHTASPLAGKSLLTAVKIARGWQQCAVGLSSCASPDAVGSALTCRA